MPAVTYSPDSPLADPEFRRERARKAAHARFTSTNLIRRLAAMAGDLSDEERGQLVAILAAPRRSE